MIIPMILVTPPCRILLIYTIDSLLYIDRIPPNGPKEQGFYGVNCGDTNSSFFHNLVRIRNHYNSIPHISDLSGNVFTNQHDISKTFVNFFTDLWTEPFGNSFLEIFNALPNDLPHLSDSEGNMLISNVSKNEIYEALQFLPSGKSPGPDGLYAGFYQFY